MKKYLDGILVVEGKEDASYLSNYIASEIVVVNGFEIKEPTIAYLKNKKVIIFTDPDEAGIKIRKTLNEKLEKAINVEIDICECTRGNKNGVAECRIDVVLDKLSPFFIEKRETIDAITAFDLYNLNISKDKCLRDYVCEQLNLGECNNKKLLRRLNLNHVKLSELEEIVKKYNNGN